jgi:hypothetical protein
MWVVQVVSFNLLPPIKRSVRGDARGHGGTGKSIDLDKSRTIQRENNKTAFLDADMVGAVKMMVSFHLCYISVSKNNKLLHLFVN